MFCSIWKLLTFTKIKIWILLFYHEWEILKIVIFSFLIHIYESLYILTIFPCDRERKYSVTETVSMEFFGNDFHWIANSLNSVTILFVFEPATFCIRDRDASTASARHRDREDPLIDPIKPKVINLLDSLNSLKVRLHLEKLQHDIPNYIICMWYYNQ